MSLQVWLPLNGDLHNQGLNNVQPTATGTIISTSGKIGSCYQFGTSASDITIPKEAMTSFTTEASVCFWIKILSWNSSYATFFQAGTASTAWAAYIFSLLRNNANSNCCFTISNGSSASNAAYLTPTLELNVWYHISLIYKTGHCLIYINGQLHQDYTTSIVPNFAGITTIKIGRCTNGSSYQTNCLINDFRIYNHALSVKEVKEIAKGLVLHYKLDDGYTEASTFLTSEITNTAYNSQNGKYGYNETSNLAKTIGYFQGKTCVKISTITAGQSAQPYSYFSNLYTSDGTNAPAYKALSFDYYTTVPTTTWLNIYKLGNGTGTATWKTTNSDGVFTGTYTNSSNSIRVKPNEWNHVEVILHGTATSDAQWGYCINGPAHTSDPNYYFLYANIQLEQNDHTTAYGSLFHNNIVYDSSGYSNNAVSVGTITTSNSSPRYNLSTNFNGASCIKNDNFNLPGKIWTVTCWYYKPTNPTGYEGLFCLSRNAGADADKKFAAMPNSSYIWYKGESGSTSISQIKIGQWTFLALVCNGSTVTVYQNDQSIGTFNAGNELTGADDLVIGARSNSANAATTSVYFTGQMSDFRIYATALAADDIKELYHTPYSIDRNGNVYAREVVET